MNNKCNNCAKFLTCNRRECKKVTFVEAEILDKPQIIKSEDEILAEITSKLSNTIQENLYPARKACKRLSEAFKKCQDLENGTT